LQAALCVGTLLLADNGNRFPAKAGEAADNGVVFAKMPVAGEWGEVREESLEVVEAMRAVWMAGDLLLLPWGRGPVAFAQGLGGALLETRNLFAHVDGFAAVGKLLEFEDLAFEVVDRLFKVEIVIHA